MKITGVPSRTTDATYTVTATGSCDILGGKASPKYGIAAPHITALAIMLQGGRVWRPVNNVMEAPS